MSPSVISTQRKIWRKGQLSLEFIAMLGFGMILLTALLYLGNSYLQEGYSTKHYTALRDLGYQVQSELVLAARAEPGYNRTFYIPFTLEEVNYTIQNTNTSFFVSYKNSRFNFNIPRMEGTISKGLNHIITNTTTIRVAQP